MCDLEGRYLSLTDQATRRCTLRFVSNNCSKGLIVLKELSDTASFLSRRTIRSKGNTATRSGLRSRGLDADIKIGQGGR